MDVKPNHIGNEVFQFDVGQTLKHEVKEVHIYFFKYIYSYI